MTAGARKALGSAALLLYLLVYIALAATVGGALAHAPWWAQLGFYAIAGFVWVFPLRPLFRWMARP